MQELNQTVELKTVNSPTVLTRVIQIIKRRRINIKKLVAEECCTNLENGKISIILETDVEKLRLLKSQFEKVIDVISVK